MKSADASADGTIQERWDRAASLVRRFDRAGALFLFKSLANDGELCAYREIANIYEIGGSNIERDYSQAYHWYKHSVDVAKGCLWTRPLIFLWERNRQRLRKGVLVF